MTATATLAAPPEPYLEAALLPATGHRVVAIGSGLGGLTATKALKHDLANLTDALVFLTRITAQGTSHLHNRATLWLHVIPTTAVALTTIGVLITLYVAIVRKRKSSQQARKGRC